MEEKSISIRRKDLSQDVSMIVLSVFVAILLVKTDSFVTVLTASKEWEMVGSFLAGIFFTSVFTTAPAIVTLGEISREWSILGTALLGGLGAIVGDLIIFHFIRDRFSEHLSELLRHRKAGIRFNTLLRLKYFRWMTFVVGGLIIASPFPDELGISLLGFSKMKTSTFVLISFIFNSAGIAFIGLVANSL